MGQVDPDGDGDRRRRLSRDGVLRTAVQLADEEGLDSVSMRNLASRLDVVPMALYNHVANKEELLDGMIDVIVGEIGPPTGDSPWKQAVRDRVLSAREVMLRHVWAREVIESRTTRTPAVLAYMDSMAGTFRAAGFSVDLTHHVMHAIGRRMWGFSHELFPNPDGIDAAAPEMAISDLADTHPYLAEIAEASDTGRACNTQMEFEFTLDLLLDGFERLHGQDWTSSARSS
jgi:AcrR family transcriptional regulator